METRSVKKTGTTGKRLTRVAVAFSFVAAPALAGEWQIEPSISVTETVTDNVDLSSNKRSDFVTDVTPGLRIDGQGGRTRLHFDYRLHEYWYANGSKRSKTENALNALGTVELVDDWFFVEGSGQISQQGLSPFGGAGLTSGNANRGDNNVETSSFRLSPYIRGNFGGYADYQLRYNHSTSRSRDNSGSAVSFSGLNSERDELIGNLHGTTALAALGWSVDLTRTEDRFANGLSNEAERLRGVLTYQLDPQFRVNINAGVESNDYLSGETKSYTTKGAGFDWSPTERTRISANREDRFFGPTNSFSFTHRTAGTAWKYVQSKDATTSAAQQGALGLGTYYDLYFNLFSSDPVFAALSPAAKTAFVNAFLNSVQLSPTAQLQGGYLTSGVRLTERRELSFAIIGARNTVTFAATQSESSNLSQGAGTGVLIGEDFVNLQKVKQRGASINWSHQLTPQSTLTGSFSRLSSVGSGAVAVETRDRLITVNFLTHLGPKTVAGLGARRVEVNGSTHYTENAFTGTLSHRF